MPLFEEKIKKRLEEFRSSPKNVLAREAVSLLQALGAERHKKSGNDHTYTYPGMLPIRVPFHSEHIKLKSGVVKTIIQWVEEILEKRGVEL